MVSVPFTGPSTSFQAFDHVQLVSFSWFDLVMYLVHQRLHQSHAKAASLALADQLVNVFRVYQVRVEPMAGILNIYTKRLVIKYRTDHYFFAGIMAIGVFDNVGAGLVNGEFQLSQITAFHTGLCADACHEL